MFEERELLTILNENEYGSVLSCLKKEFGEPKIQRRLSLQSNDYNRVDMDTRIRITNGKAELMQKVGDWKNITKGESRTEISISLPSDAKMVVDLYEIIRNLTVGSKIENIIMQFENFVWKKKEFEIKLTHQFGKGDGYNCEIEVFDELLNPEDLARKYNIPIHLPTENNDFWRKWNKKVNLSADEISDEELLEIVSRYL